MTQSPHPVGRGQTLAALGVLAVLAAIAAGVFLKQFYYDRSIFGAAAPQAATKKSPAAPAGFALTDFAPVDLSAAGPAEQFDRQGLSDKIDGKAETYLPVGFVRMDCQRFALKANPRETLEAFVYDMGSPANAYSVFSVQRRSGSQEVPLGDFAYQSSNALYFCHGRHYVELIAACTSLGPTMQQMGRNFTSAVAAEKQAMEELSLFPPEGLVKDSIIRASEADFGVPGFANVYRATYQASGKAVTAFMSKQETPAKALELAVAYRKYYGQYGAKEITEGLGVPGATLLDLDGIYKIVLVAGNMVAGVDEAQDVQAAKAVADLLQRRLGEPAK